MRQSTVQRDTLETQITLTLELDGSGEGMIRTGCGFLDHMLTLLSKHALMDLSVTCHGDNMVDDHHTVEDVGICLGQALRRALGDKRGIHRYGDCALPMDEALVLVALDLSGRAALTYKMRIPARKVGTFDTELAEEFFSALCREAGITLHIRQLCGRSSHHLIEAAFKGFARALREAASPDEQLGDALPSTKGSL